MSPLLLGGGPGAGNGVKSSMANDLVSHAYKMKLL